METYHKELGFPKWFTKPEGIKDLRYTNHAVRASQTDRYGRIQLPARLDTRCDLIEVGVEDGKVAKLVYRGRYDKQYDLVIVVIPGEWIVKTVWLNDRADEHKTLQTWKYSTKGI